MESQEHKPNEEVCAWKCDKSLFSNGCRRIDGYVKDVCGAYCPWRQTAQDVEASRERARKNYLKRHGVDGFEKQTYVQRGFTLEELKIMLLSRK